MDAARSHASALPVKTFPNGLLRVDMQWLEGGDLLPLSESDRPDGFRMVGDANEVARLPLGQDLHITFPDLLGKGVEMSGKQKKRLVGEGKSLPPFMDAALAQKDRLPPRAQGGANHLPFFESDGGNHECSAEVIGSDRRLLTRAKNPGLENHAIRRGVEAIAVAVRAECGATANDRVTALANLVACGVGGDLRSSGGAVRWRGVGHGGDEKSGTGEPVRLFRWIE